MNLVLLKNTPTLITELLIDTFIGCRNEPQYKNDNGETINLSVDLIFLENSKYNLDIWETYGASGLFKRNLKIESGRMEKLNSETFALYQNQTNGERPIGVFSISKDLKILHLCKMLLNTNVDQNVFLKLYRMQPNNNQLINMGAI